MMAFAVSDLHVHFEEQPFLFTSEKEAIFSKLAAEALHSETRLVVAGDGFDFTGMQTPPLGHREFFEEIFPASALREPVLLNALKPIGPKAALSKIRERFPALFESFALLAREGLLTWIPGNHDCVFRDDRMQRAFTRELGVPSDSIQWRNSLYLDGVAFAAHGNQFDRSNRNMPDSCRNPGVAITEALYRALMPALRLLGLDSKIVDAIPAVRPEEAVIHGIAQYFGDRQATRLIAAFVRLIAKNGYFTGSRRALGFPLSHRVPGVSALIELFLTPGNFCKALPDDSKLKDHVRARAKLARGLLHPEPEFVVLGHTHEVDWAPGYLNLGTWIDHLTGISLEHLRSVDTSLPVLSIDPSEISLVDARDLVHKPSLGECRKIVSFSRDEALQRRPAA